MSRRIVLRSTIVALLGVMLGLACWWITRILTERFDILIINGFVIDGTGAPGRKETIGIRDSRFVEVTWPMFAEAERTIDADGLVVAPGFIDVHTHIEPNIGGSGGPIAAPNFIVQGITTIITGNCGRSALSIADLFRLIERRGIEVNVGSLVGHNTIRKEVMGEVARAPTEAELRRMKALVERAMQSGALGISTGLEYTPGVFAGKEEITALVEVASQYRGIYATHLRDEGNRVVSAIREALHIARETHTALQLSHLKWRGRVNWGQSQQLIDMITEAKRSGMNVTYDIYPYTASSTSIDILIPSAAREGGRPGLRKKLTDPAARRHIIEAILAQMRSEGWNDFSFARVAYCVFAPELNGRSIPEVTALLGGKTAASQAVPLSGQNPVPLDGPDRTNNRDVDKSDDVPEMPPLTQKNSEELAPRRAAVDHSVKAFAMKRASGKRPSRNYTEGHSSAEEKPDRRSILAAENSHKRDKNDGNSRKKVYAITGNAVVAVKEKARQQKSAGGISEGDTESRLRLHTTTARAQTETICYLASRGGAQMIYENMSEEDVVRLVRFPDCMLGSDSGIRSGEGRPHPRGYGSAPRLIGLFAMERGILSLEDAVRRLTSLPADTFGLRGRGRISSGYYADIVIFDPSRIRDRATFVDPFQGPDGIIWVLVNGQIVQDRGRRVSSYSGQVFKRTT